MPESHQERYLGAEDIAQRLNVSPITVRKWLREGRLKGVRAGRLWRVKEGDLQAFLERKGPQQTRAELSNHILCQTDQKIVLELKTRLQQVAGEQVQAVIIYGSRVWGRPGPDSDLDVAVIVQGYTPVLERALQEAAYKVMWDHDFSPLIALKVFDARHFLDHQERGFSFYRKVAQEGVSL